MENQPSCYVPHILLTAYSWPSTKLIKWLHPIHIGGGGDTCTHVVIPSDCKRNKDF